MLYHQYHCACCEKAVSSSEKSCSNCGSQNIRTPYGFWLFCIFACLIVAIAFKVGHVYLQAEQEVPAQQGFLDALHKTNKNMDS
ncbi:hypothetical protein G9F31_05465 [Acinetobacter sp. 187]|uniref:Uncharacterized protein n=1 Tax=Acinetobacter lanii TaxID=2715163 RepID=A0A6G8S3K9_9GAMM|nr:hypothetical protein [Acinetobacter lanii]NHC03218.1 hypothetical protein [Acinetobacter lanii]QIO08725.1 hypothetical protein G8D99_06625 [Acinetobacter lanii]